MSNDIRTQRTRQAEQDFQVDNAQPAHVDCSMAILVTTTTVTTYPTAAASFFAANPTEIDGSEVEGGAATYTPDTTTVLYVLNEGSQVPPNGTRLVATQTGGRHCVRYDG